MVSTRSITTRTKLARRSAIAVLALLDDVVVHIVGLVTTSSPQPMADLCNLRNIYKAMYKAFKKHTAGRCVALEREEAMKWRDNERYLTVVNHLAGAGNPEACFIVGLALVFAPQDMQRGLLFLERTTVAGHKAVAYVLTLLLYTAGETRYVGKYYIRQVEGEPADDRCETAKRTNRECRRCQRLAADMIQAAVWGKKVGPLGPVWVLLEDDHRCTSTGCGVEGWDDYAVFCSDDCRIRHEYANFFADVLNYLP